MQIPLCPQLQLANCKCNPPKTARPQFSAPHGVLWLQGDIQCRNCLCMKTMPMNSMRSTDSGGPLGALIQSKDGEQANDTTFAVTTQPRPSSALHTCSPTPRCRSCTQSIAQMQCIPRHHGHMPNICDVYHSSYSSYSWVVHVAYHLHVILPPQHVARNYLL
jgi:hypothetical protein